MLIASATVIGSHILLQDSTKPLIDAIGRGMRQPGDHYPVSVYIASCATAVLTISVNAFLYYHAGHLLTISNRLMKSLVLAALLLEAKGELIRTPLVEYVYSVHLGAQNPLVFVALNHIGVWIPNLILALCLVYLCPMRNSLDERAIPTVTNRINE
jgi:hypothetical protein